MKVILVNGSPHEKGCTYTALSEVARVLNGEGIDTEIFHIGNAPISGCRGCGACRKLGRCVIDDAVNEFAAKAKEADALFSALPCITHPWAEALRRLWTDFSTARARRLCA